MLAEWRGKPLVRHVAEAALASAAGPVIVVTGAHRTSIVEALGALPVCLTNNPRFSEGLSTSLQKGFEALPSATAGAVVLLGDMPTVSAGLIDSIVAAWRHHAEPAALVPTHDGRRGNPVLLSRRLEGEIAMLTGDAGAGSILRGRGDVVEWEAVDRAVLHDIDTPEALAQLSVPSTTPPRMAE